MAHKPYFHVSDKHTGELAHKRSEHTHTYIHTYIYPYTHTYIYMHVVCAYIRYINTLKEVYIGDKNTVCTLA